MITATDFGHTTFRDETFAVQRAAADHVSGRPGAWATYTFEPLWPAGRTLRVTVEGREIGFARSTER